MPVRKKHHNLTFLIIPSPEKSVFSFSIPRWLPWIALLVLIGLVCVMGFFIADYQRLRHQIAELEREREVQELRDQYLRLVILSQQEKAKELDWEVQSLREKAKEVDELASQVRELIGLPQATHSVSETIEAFARGKGPLGHIPRGVQLEQAREADLTLFGKSYWAAQELGETFDGQKEALGKLTDALMRRIIRIPPQKRQSPEELQRQLRILAAAPTRWPVDCRLITSEFGYRIFKGHREFHTGIDIGVWYKTPVRATKSGKVIFAGWHPQYGWMVEIQHDMGYSTLYAHNSYYLVEVGDEVKEWQVIALSGDSGNTNGPHLHYEIRLNGKPIDPMIFLSLGESEEGK